MEGTEHPLHDDYVYAVTDKEVYLQTDDEKPPIPGTSLPSTSAIAAVWICNECVARMARILAEEPQWPGRPVVHGRRGDRERRGAAAPGRGRRSGAGVRKPQLCDDPQVGLCPRPDGYSGNAAEQDRPQQMKGVAVDIIGVIIAGIIIGLLGKFFAPGDRDNIPLWLTVVCGVGGVIIGYYLAAALGVDATRGIDWIRWIISIVVAAVLVMIAASVTGRRGRTI